MSHFGAPPKGGWARLVCELLVSDIELSRKFWLDSLGFTIAYQRPLEKFLYLERPEGCQIMLCERSGLWETATLERPYGRGVMLQVFVESLDSIQDRLERAKIDLEMQPREVWRNYGNCEGGKREIAVLDPDGYLVLIAEDLGMRSLGNSSTAGMR